MFTFVCKTANYPCGKLYDVASRSLSFGSLVITTPIGLGLLLAHKLSSSRTLNLNPAILNSCTSEANFKIHLGTSPANSMNQLRKNFFPELALIFRLLLRTPSPAGGEWAKQKSTAKELGRGHTKHRPHVCPAAFWNFPGQPSRPAPVPLELTCLSTSVSMGTNDGSHKSYGEPDFESCGRKCLFVYLPTD